ncbi:MAG: 5-(carboxyamino)imidazole ribonucleotide mutase [Candidatus Omnitrophica bacterium]|jgi:phosphoribosylaminoimidazole carboxylase PurE protein|nr:5-(carboxyamino)imidazole ribonucleotide mutase [Candidatus Omnitrophota bacterium]MDD5077717.1 5-(carboxyamino)imidazole ribonucleotide mutase [Candidatus Omnitrophota bacterium]MDD5725066.1 5-(carboxyamino)imidazole ribonucleotide mutase [Candidatus Omnitrophota bacterium]
MKKISIVMGSKSDLETVSETVNVLNEFKTEFDLKVLSAHRSPQDLIRYVEKSSESGTKVFIAAAGMSAALAGVIAAHTTLPVIGIPVETRNLKGLDSLLSTVQMPPGIPVGCMSIGKPGAKNAALFALEILGTEDSKIRARLARYKKQMRASIRKTRISL